MTDRADAISPSVELPGRRLPVDASALQGSCIERPRRLEADAPRMTATMTNAVQRKEASNEAT